MSSDLRPFSSTDAPPTTASSAAAAAKQMSSASSPWTNKVPLPARLKTNTTMTSPHHDLTLPIITLSNRGCSSSDPRSAPATVTPGATAPCGFRMDDPSEGPRCLSLPLSRVQQDQQRAHQHQQQQRPTTKPPQNDPPPPYTNCSSSLDNLSLCSALPDPSALGGSGSAGPPHGGRLIKASSDNPVYGSSASPPVPPRDYIPRATSRPTMLDQRQLQTRPEIHPIVQDGQKRSNTHYWLLPDKQKTSASLDDVDKMAAAAADDDQQHYINIAGNGLWARKFGISKASSFGHKKPGNAARKEDVPRRNHHASEGADTTCQRSVFYSDMVPLLSDVSSLDSMSVNIPANEMEDVTFPSEDGCTTSMGEIREMIDTVQSKIDGVTADESFTALATSHWNVQAAVEYLKVENLFRLGLASRERCRRKLEINNWNVERAASDLLDLIQLDSRK